MTTPTKPNTGFWIIAIIALIWNCMGVFQFLSMSLMKEELQQAMTVEQIALVDSLPSWYTAVFATAVFGGLLGSLFLLIRKRWAIPMFLISLVAVLVQMLYWLLATAAMDVYGTGAVVMPLLVIIVAIFLYYYSKGAAQKGWLR
ncbi:hypothetical protein [Altibacter sp.]|uniref:hypothetical protein n=1 Tax=Altibacter sp. TaxID=2024823 RepID=UPI0025BDDA58|nr:hypothetical protein [Altibacter sp.]